MADHQSDHGSFVQKILITGSSGIIGKIILSALIDIDIVSGLILIDKQDSKEPINLLTDDLSKYFKDVDVVIHLAAHTSPFIGTNQAEENIEMCRRLIKACDTSTSIKKIINASSVNVYPYFEMYNKKETITRTTTLSPNMRFIPGEYAKAKIESERLLKGFCEKRRMSLINLRLGHITSNDIIPESENSHDADVEKMIFLHHKDLCKIIIGCLSPSMTGIRSFVCVSNKSELFSEDIRFPLTLPTA